MTRIPRLTLSLILLTVFACFLLSEYVLRSTAVTTLPSPPAAPEEEISFRLLFGLTDTARTKWDGSTQRRWIGRVAAITTTDMGANTRGG